jgi:hypothetical protein
MASSLKRTFPEVEGTVQATDDKSLQLGLAVLDTFFIDIH